jgi:hypothetical protein
MLLPRNPRHCQSRLGCRLNAGFAQWAEPHGCGESCPPPWMADGSGPTERGRSEGTPTKEGPNQEQAPLVTWGWCDFRLFQVTRRRRNKSAVRQTLLILNLNLKPKQKAPASLETRAFASALFKHSYIKPRPPALSRCLLWPSPARRAHPQPPHHHAPRHAHR